MSLADLRLSFPVSWELLWPFQWTGTFLGLYVGGPGRCLRACRVRLSIFLKCCRVTELCRTCHWSTGWSSSAKNNSSGEPGVIVFLCTCLLEFRKVTLNCSKAKAFVWQVKRRSIYQWEQMLFCGNYLQASVQPFMKIRTLICLHYLQKHECFGKFILHFGYFFAIVMLEYSTSYFVHYISAETHLYTPSFIYIFFSSTLEF